MGGNAVGGSHTGGDAAGGDAAGGGGSTPSQVAVPAELTAANGRLSGSGYQLDFQLGRIFHQRTAAATEHTLAPATPITN